MLPAVPYPGQYLIAYFDERFRLVTEAVRLVEISITSSPEPWHRGDAVMALRKTHQRI